MQKLQDNQLKCTAQHVVNVDFQAHNIIESENAEQNWWKKYDWIKLSKYESFLRRFA